MAYGLKASSCVPLKKAYPFVIVFHIEMDIWISYAAFEDLSARRLDKISPYLAKLSYLWFWVA